MMRHQIKRTDANHAEFLRTLKRFGVPYIDLAPVGKGCPDICALVRGVWQMIEVKDGSKPPSERTLTPAQQPFHKSVTEKGGKIWIMTRTEQLLALLGARLS